MQLSSRFEGAGYLGRVDSEETVVRLREVCLICAVVAQEFQSATSFGEFVS